MFLIHERCILYNTPVIYVLLKIYCNVTEILFCNAACNWKAALANWLDPRILDSRTRLLLQRRRLATVVMNLVAFHKYNVLLSILIGRFAADNSAHKDNGIHIH